MIQLIYDVMTIPFQNTFISFLVTDKIIMHFQSLEHKNKLLTFENCCNSVCIKNKRLRIV